MFQLKNRIRFGTFAPDLYVQLGTNKGMVAPFQRDADAITRLNLRHLLTELEVIRAREKLVKSILRKMEEVFGAEKHSREKNSVQRHGVGMVRPRKQCPEASPGRNQALDAQDATPPDPQALETQD